VAPAPGAALATSGLHALNDRGQPALVDVSLEVRPGEIVAIAGVEGNGQAELEETVVGIRPASGGAVLLDGRDVTREPPETRLRAGLRYIPSDRYRRGLVRGLAVAENLFLDRVDRPPFGSRFTLRRRTIFERAVELIRRFGIQVRGPGEPAGTLSGGNAQRVVLARALSWELKALLAAQPTRGLDVGAIEFVWDQLRRQRDAGAGILLISTDLDEVMALADRCYVMYRGRLVAHWSRGELDRERIGLAMGGVVGSEEVGAGGR
jgi:simple sugar transport system ATP-binding protein